MNFDKTRVFSKRHFYKSRVILSLGILRELAKLLRYGNGWIGTNYKKKWPEIAAIALKTC